VKEIKNEELEQTIYIPKQRSQDARREIERGFRSADSLHHDRPDWRSEVFLDCDPE